MAEACELHRKNFAVYALYGIEDNMKHFVNLVYIAKYTKESTTMEVKLLTLLFDKTPEVRSYLLSHPELRKNKEYAKLYGRIEKKE